MGGSRWADDDGAAFLEVEAVVVRVGIGRAVPVALPFFVTTTASTEGGGVAALLPRLRLLLLATLLALAAPPGGLCCDDCNVLSFS